MTLFLSSSLREIAEHRVDVELESTAGAGCVDVYEGGRRSGSSFSFFARCPRRGADDLWSNVILRSIVNARVGLLAY
jgi:hypothetical protein